MGAILVSFNTAVYNRVHVLKILFYNISKSFEVYSVRFSEVRNRCVLYY